MISGNLPSGGREHEETRDSVQHLLLYRRLQPLYEYYRDELPSAGPAKLGADMRDHLLEHIRSLAVLCRIDRCGGEFWYEVFTLCYQLLARSRVTEALEIAHRFADQVDEVLASSLSFGSRLCIYDMFKHLFFMAGKDFVEYRPFDEGVVKPYSVWLRTLAGPAANGSTRGRLDRGRRLRIGYLCNYAVMMAPGRPAAPLFISMILDHQAHVEHDCIVYAVGACDPAWRDVLKDRGIAVVSLTSPDYPAGGDRDFLRALAVVRNDALDVLLTDDNMAMPAYLFAHRVAPVQTYVAMGMPFWGLADLDYIIIGSNSLDASPDLPAERKISGRYGYDPMLLDKAGDPKAIVAARQDIPSTHRIGGTFTRFVRITPEFLGVLGRILDANPNFTMIIAGNGDPGRIGEFIAQCPHSDRVRFFDHDVDIFIYGRIIDFLIDTPIRSGNICREMLYFGKPVVSLHNAAFAQYLAELRDHELVAADLDDYVRIASRLIQEPDYLHARSAAAREIGSGDTRSGNHAALLRELIARATA